MDDFPPSSVASTGAYSPEPAPRTPERMVAGDRRKGGEVTAQDILHCFIECILSKNLKHAKQKQEMFAYLYDKAHPYHEKQNMTNL